MQRGLGGTCTSAQTYQSIHCLHTQSKDRDEGSAKKLRLLTSLNSCADLYKEWLDMFCKHQNPITGSNNIIIVTSVKHWYVKRASRLDNGVNGTLQLFAFWVIFHASIAVC